MKFINYLIILLLISINLGAQEMSITPEQDNMNKKYLIQLNDNLLSTINMLEAFNKQATEIYLIKQGDFYNSFLLDLTMQCSNLIGKIRQAEIMTAEDRELQIRALIATIKADVEYLPTDISDKQQQQNSNYLANVEKNLKSQIASVLQAIVKEEKVILEKGEVTQNYFRLHSHHFLFPCWRTLSYHPII